MTADPIGERRQVTVLFADLTGSTSWGQELDAEEVHALLEQFFDRADRAVQEYGGHIVRHIGDCVMAIFGAPVAHDDDAQRAARAALAIQAAIPEVSARVGRPVGVHIGLAGGQVVASRTGSANYSEYTVTGNAANLASRLTDAAKAGEIFVSDETHDALTERFDCADAGTLDIKGFAEPVLAWRLSGLRTMLREQRPFVGRRAELRLIKATLAACRETARGQAVHVRGEAGIGKSRLIEEVQRTAEEAGFADKVTVFTESEFGRTVSPVSHSGSGDGWGNHHLVMGGSVLGHDIYGTFPDMVTAERDADGGWVPTTSREQYLSTLANWAGVPYSDLQGAFPRLRGNANLGFMT